ncbi:MAG: Gfo/Idh/MocA family oxidoreductase [Bacteroidia bacterium]
MEKNILKVGLVGASAKGGWGAIAHVPAIKSLKNLELAAVCTSGPESAKAASKAFNVDRSFYDINELVTQNDLDIISAVVKIPDHFSVVKTALEAGKHVYCEWPLGIDLTETEQLANLAKEKNLTCAIGLQGYWAPELLFLKQLFEEGWFGKVLSVKMSMQTKTSLERTTEEAWREEKFRKATLFSIVGGHTLFYLSHIFGGISEVSGLLTTQLNELTMSNSGKKVKNEVYDQILIQGLLSKKTPFTNQIIAVPYHSNGWSLEIYGTKGVIKATSKMLPQITPIKLLGSKNGEEFKIMETPADLEKFSNLPKGPSGNVGRNYGSLARSIINKSEFHPNFDDALKVQKLLDTIEKSAKEKRT